MINTNIFIFKPFSESIKYGVGTYISTLANNSKNNNFFIVELFFPDCKTFNFISNRNHNIIQIPYLKEEYKIINGLSADEKTTESIWRLICPYIDTRNKNVFHFQTPFLYELAKKISKNKEHKILYTFHKLRWKYYFNCTFKYFNYLIDSDNPYSNFVRLKLSQEKKLCELSHGIIALTFQSEKYLKKQYNIPCEKIYVIKNGIEIIKDDSLSSDFNEVDEASFIFLFVGRVCEEKGINYLLKAFDKLAGEFSNIKLIIIGDGDLPKVKLKNHAKIKFLGHQNKNSLVKFYSYANIGVIPSFNEECSYVALEMMNYKIPIICSDLSGLNEMFVNKVDSLKFNSYYDKNHILKLSVKDLKSKMEILFNNEKLRNELKENAYISLTEKYNVDLMKKMTTEVYKLI